MARYKDITKKDGIKFRKLFHAELLAVGAVVTEDSDWRTVFTLDTIVGVLTISLYEQHTCYTVFSRFEDVAKAKLKFNCNPYSGKYNTHIGRSEALTVEKAVEIAMIHIEATLPKETA